MTYETFSAVECKKDMIPNDVDINKNSTLKLCPPVDKLHFMNSK